jgi:hypothetical protein
LHGFVFAGDLTALKYFPLDLKSEHKQMSYTITFILHGQFSEARPVEQY